MLLKKLTKITAVLLAAAAVFTVSAGADDNAKTRASLEKSARSYLKRGNYTYAYTALDEYASLSREMAEAGELHPYLADTARAMADYYRFEPEVLALYGSRRFFRGSDGYVSDTANAVRLDVPFTIANVEDFYHFIPNRTEEVGVLVSLNVNTEKEMISIASGGFEGKIAENMRQLSRIEGQVYLTFCPGVDAVKKSRTIHMSYKNAYITIAEAARRYAPNVQLVYSVSDVPVPGEDTVSRFYPGDEYVDVFGVEVSSAFRADPFATEEELYWYRRGEFYDPVWSVQVMEEKFRLATGRECPLMVTGVSFPWDGRNSIDDYGEQMRGFYEKLPEVCPALVGIFYSGKSSSDAMCNLRSNPEAARIYEECLALPVRAAVRIDGISPVAEDFSLTLSAGGFFRKGDVTLKYNGSICDSIPCITGESARVDLCFDGDEAGYLISLNMYTDEGGAVVLEYIVPEYDYNGNGYLDFGDCDFLTAFISGWDIDLGDCPTDVNGDGATNLYDVTALGSLMLP